MQKDLQEDVQIAHLWQHLAHSPGLSATISQGQRSLTRLSVRLPNPGDRSPTFFKLMLFVIITGIVLLFYKSF